jgi:hypothetical protein
VEVVRVREAGLSHASDPEILGWAAAEGRVLLTHDRKTMADFAYDRVRAGLRMAGVVEVPNAMPIGRAVDELETLVICSLEDEHEGQVIYLPL